MDELMLEIEQVEGFLYILWRFFLAMFLDDCNLMFLVLDEEVFTIRNLLVA